MIALKASEIALIVGGELHGSDVTVTAAPVFDSSQATPGSIFLALKGEKADGHKYVADAFSRGAVLAFVTAASPERCIVVPDVLEALNKLGAHVRKQLKNLQVIALTGSQGKTTTKEFLNSILTLDGQTIATDGNFNTDIGVPLTLLRSNETTKYCVLEMGARHMGDIARLTKVAKPNVGVVLVVGTAHLGEFGSVAAIAKTKSELITNLPGKSTAVLGTYDSYTPKMADSLELEKILFGQNQAVRAADVEIHGGFAHFDLVTPTARTAVSLQVLGEHQIPNALAAAAAAYALGVSNEVIAEGLITATLDSKWRMQIEEVNGVQIIHDYYNANPESMQAALKTLTLLTQESGGSSWAILGKMHELGALEVQGHQGVTSYSRAAGVDHFVAVATNLYQDDANQSFTENMQQHNCLNAQAVLELVNNVSVGDVILLKASRSERFEELAVLIKDKLNGVGK